MTSSRSPLSPLELEDAFIKVTFEEDAMPQLASGAADPAYEPWVDQASNKFAEPPVFMARQLRKLYPKHSVTLVQDHSTNVLGFPGAMVQPTSPADLITNCIFIPVARHMSSVPGVLVDQVQFGSFTVAWDKHDFLVYVVKYPYGMGYMNQTFVLHEGPEEPSRALLVAAGGWHSQLHQEILVFNGNYWEKSYPLWAEVQKANWADVILKEEFKTAMQKDIRGFFDSEKLYKSLGIAWKRGLIMYGPPGNGKTISMKAVMKECDDKGYAPLYVKTFTGWLGDEVAMQATFNMARQMAPCVLILEDLDSLITDRNRSFFLNQLDGIESNDGILIIGSTNHFDRLDPALNNRPSRFDRKYLFDDPNEDERALYAMYWQNKLKNNNSIDFPDSLVKEVASQTEGFSFAYLKEAFVATLVLMAGQDGDDKPDFAALLKAQIKVLREQLDKDKDARGHARTSVASTQPPSPSAQFGRRPPHSSSLFKVDERMLGMPRIWDTSSGSVGGMPGGLPGASGPSSPETGLGARRELRSMAYSFGRSFMP
ncbi:P-loop containing nucleoside triphosphate hydrolase protein [Epithele typhae]|uniref:P-loop containing nucleoside triphosphate hydrolase protein n=1 Tax=Epithele typhae TaxID=378194 RepID=UPI002007437C|nr:P-loop containing nucleoside triphosphate hydrolase protein [Epithele typhae]KAH9927199.1 P-loop containing nucleoside triphosphate hydrolase protein [Epithele typhae]